MGSTKLDSVLILLLLNSKFKLVLNLIYTTNYFSMRDAFNQKNILEKHYVRKKKVLEIRNFDFFVTAYNADKNQLDDGSKKTDLITGIFFTWPIEFLQICYSLGTSLDELKKSHLPEIIRRLKFTAVELANLPGKQIFKRDSSSNKIAISKLHSQLSILVWLICLGVSDEELSQIVPMFSLGGDDRFLDLICRYYDSSRTLSSECAYPKAFGLLDQLISEPNTKHPELIKSYLDNWPRAINLIGGASLGFRVELGNGKVRTADDLVAGINQDYRGFWCWEAALAVKFFHIDDNTFKDHIFYPYDLVHYTPALENHSYISSLDLEPSNLALENLAPQPNKILTEEKNKTINGVNFIYHAHKLKTESQSKTSPDIVSDAAVRYSVYIETDPEKIEIEKGDAAYVSAVDSYFNSEQHASMNMEQLLEQYGQSEIRNFMQEVFLHMEGSKNHCAYLYCSRSNETTVEPLLILRYRKFIDAKALIINCMVRDPKLLISEVLEHWDYLIEQYQDTI